MISLSRRQDGPLQSEALRATNALLFQFQIILSPRSWWEMKGNDKCSFRFSVLTKSYNMHTVQIQKVVERREAQAWNCLVSPSGTFFSQLFFNRWVKRCSVFAGEIFETGTRKINRVNHVQFLQRSLKLSAPSSSCHFQQSVHFFLCSVQWLCCFLVVHPRFIHACISPRCSMITEM